MRITQGQKEWLRQRFRERVRFSEPMSRHTRFRIGGPAEALVLPESIGDLAMLLTFARQEGVPWMVMGGGTNLLVKDGGIPGLVVVMKAGLRTISLRPDGNDRTLATAMAGASLKSLCRLALSRGLGGMSFALGIPGTVGGAIRMNAGTALGTVAGVLEAVRILTPAGEMRSIHRRDLTFSYRCLSLGDAAEGEPIIVEGLFLLRPGREEALKREAMQLVRIRKERQPLHLPSAGCFFKNPPAGRPAGELIEKAGLKGKRIGGAEVSPRHANFIVNTGGATATDVLALQETVRETVWKMFHVTLEPEVKIVGT